MTLEFGHVTYHLEYLDSVLKAMYESWDDLLFNLDNQLASYSKVCRDIHVSEVWCVGVWVC